MYMTMRRVHCAPGRFGEVMARGVPMMETLNERFGVDLHAAINIGTDPDVIGISGAWETLGAYHAYREALMADEEMMANMSEIGALVTSMEDVIGRILMPPGEAAPFTTLAEARMHMPRIAEAIPFGIEISEFVESKTGFKTAFMNATTGDRSVVAWVTRFDTLDKAAETGEMLEADPEYLDLFKRADGLFVDGSLAQTLWQRVV